MKTLRRTEPGRTRSCWAEKQHLSTCSHRNTTPPLVPSFTCPPPHEQHAGPFLGTHRSYKRGPCCPGPLSGARRHAWTHQPGIRLLLLGRSQGPRCSPPLQRATSVRVRGDEKRYECESAECDRRGPRCTLRTTPCCLSGRGSHAALRKHHRRAEPAKVERTEERPDKQVESEEDGFCTCGVVKNNHENTDGARVISVRATGPNVCTNYLIRATIETEVRQVGEDGGGQESPHRRQNFLHNAPKNHIPWCRRSQT